VTGTNKLGYPQRQWKKMPKSGKSSQMSGSEQALEVAIVDVEKAVNLGTRAELDFVSRPLTILVPAK
jgi:hypothetical protein